MQVTPTHAPPPTHPRTLARTVELGQQQHVGDTQGGGHKGGSVAVRGLAVGTARLQFVSPRCAQQVWPHHRPLNGDGRQPPGSSFQQLRPVCTNTIPMAVWCQEAATAVAPPHTQRATAYLTTRRMQAPRHHACTRMDDRHRWAFSPATCHRHHRIVRWHSALSAAFLARCRVSHPRTSRCMVATATALRAARLLRRACRRRWRSNARRCFAARRPRMPRNMRCVRGVCAGHHRARWATQVRCACAVRECTSGLRCNHGLRQRHGAHVPECATQQPSAPYVV